MKNYILIFIIFFVIVACGTKSDSNQNKANNEKSLDTLQILIEKIVAENAEEALKDTLINSLSIGVYDDGDTYTFHFGELAKGQKNKPNDSTIYEIASVTKTFTGTLAAKAVLEGKLNLEDDIQKFLPKPYPNLEYDGHPVKIKHLLTHTSGLPGGILGMPEASQGLDELEFNKVYLEYENKSTKPDFLNHLSKISISQTPGVSFNYSNPGSNLLGYILENIYTKSFQELVMDEVVAKAKMNDTYFHIPKSKEHRLAGGYRLNKSMPKSNLANTLWGAEGALKSTLPDMLKYVKYQLEDREVVKESHRKIYQIDTDYWIGYYWWAISNQNHDLHFRHDGGISRAKNVLVIYPEQKIGISIFTNQSSSIINENLQLLTYNIYNKIKDMKKVHNTVYK